MSKLDSHILIIQKELAIADKSLQNLVGYMDNKVYISAAIELGVLIALGSRITESAKLAAKALHEEAANRS